MIKPIHAMLIMGTLGLAGCGAAGQAPAELAIDNVLTDAERAAGVFTPEVMWKMGRIGEQTLSPDGATVVYTVTWYDMAENRGTTSLYAIPSAGGEAVRLTDFTGNDTAPDWSVDGQTIYFLSTRGGSGQLWRVGADGAGIRQLTAIEGGIEGYGIAPSGDRVWYTRRVAAGPQPDRHPDLPKSGARVYDELMERHWDRWADGRYSHIFVAPFDGETVGEGTDILAGEPFDAPLSPYFDTAEIGWSADGARLAYTCKKLTGTDYAGSTNSDIYIYEVATAATHNVTEGMPGYEKYPRFSLDGSKLAFISWARPGNEADRMRLMVKELSTGEVVHIGANFDHGVENIRWEGEGSIWFTAAIEGGSQIGRADVAARSVSLVTSDDAYWGAYTLSAGVLVGARTRIDRAVELYRVDPRTGASTPLTSVNGEIYDHIAMGEVQKRWVATTDGKQMLVWVIVPPGFDPSKKYPAILYCSGGPQSVIGHNWSYRWNFELMAAAGYVVVAPNRRGALSFGQEWVDQISGDYHGQNMRDYLSAIDALAAEPWVDEGRLACVGASYGAYSTYWLAGNHGGRFKAFIAHCGMFNLESFYVETEEVFFPNNDLGGPYWDTDNATAQASYAHSPHRYVQKWDTPMLIFSGLDDFRIPYTENLQAFHAARLRGVPARLVTFADEAHQVFKPQNSIVWNREFFGWLDKYLVGE